MTSNNAVRRAVRDILFVSATTASAIASLPAVAAAPDESEKTLTEVVVTGSRIRRVDEETASPVYIIDQAAIQQSGVTTVGDLVSRIPSIAGAATNPQVNNGGGFGEANIELRGLDAKRTLILLDGRRIGIVGATDATDVNQIPLNMIERVEVLKEGAGAIYGSDAIAGVVNFITRKNVSGVEVHADYGQTSRHDGKHHSIDLTFGGSGDKYSFTAGGNFSRQDAVSAGARDFSKFALYLYGGTYGAYHGGSSRSPTGRIYLPAAGPNPLGCTVSQGQFSVTRIPGASGSSVSDYGCFGANGNPGAYNYQPDNLLLTPQDRGALFAKISYHVNDSVETYANVLYNRTHSGFQEAALPFDSQVDDVIISKDSIYNPFGIDFGGIDKVNPEAEWRLNSLGDRRSDSVSESKIVNGGVRGSILNTGWQWDLNLGYSRLDQTQKIDGYLLKPLLQPAFGPSFLDPANGNAPTCGTIAAPISTANCTPVNPFNLTSADQIAALGKIATAYSTDSTFRYKSVSLDLNGKIVDLPAGELLASVGFDYSGQEGSFTADSIAQASPPLYLTCLISNEACTGDSRGAYQTRQAYVELFAPLLKDLPGVKALNVDYGVRYSDYDLFGNTTRSQFKVEYRPIADVLIRGTYSQVFRVPTITDISAAPVNTSVTFIDPCVGLTAGAVAANPNLALACQNVPTDGTFGQSGNGQITGVLTSNASLKPETGDVITFGAIYDVSQLPGLSFELDYWKYKIENLITTLDATYSINQCIASGSPQFCNLVTRVGSASSTPGQILVFQEPTFNLGELRTDGLDLGIRYLLKNTVIGSFQTTVDITRINSYENTPAPGATPVEVVGTYNRQFGNYAQYRGMFNVGWDWKGVDALLTARYIHHIRLEHPAGCNSTVGCVNAVPVAGSPPYPDLQIPSYTYLDLTVGYTFPTNTKLQIGVRNIGDKQPPILYQNNVTNANTNVETYDTLGRQFWVGATQKF